MYSLVRVHAPAGLSHLMGPIKIRSEEKAMSNSPRRRHGFTLVELLVVIGIIALLVSILLPTLSRVRKQAYGVQCQANIRQICQGLIMYANAFKGWYPSCAGRGSWTNGPTADQAQSDWLWWHQKGNPNVPGPRDINQSQIAKFLNIRGEKLVELLRCKLDPTVEIRQQNILTEVGTYNYSYTVSDRICRELWNTGPITNRFGATIKTKVIHRPSDKVLVAEEQSPNDGRWTVPWVVSTQKPDTSGNPDFLTIRHAREQRITVSGSPVGQPWEKYKGAYCGMADGHVEILSNEQAYDPRYWDPTQN